MPLTAALFRMALQSPRIPTVPSPQNRRAAGGVGCKLKPAAPSEKPICSSPHGAHFKGPLGTEVLATGPGIVEKVGTNNHLGRYVVINHSRNVKSSYGHLEASTVKRGQRSVLVT